MERFGKYGNWIIGLIFAVIVIAVYKTFDNFSKIVDAVKLVWNALTPFVIGFVVAYILNIPCKKLVSTFRNSKRLFLKNHAKALSISIIYLSVLLLLFIVIRSVVPALYKNLVDLYNNAPRYFDEAVSWIVKWQKEYNITIFEVDKLTATNAMNNILNNIDIAQFSKYAQGVVKLTSSAMNLLIGIIASIYMTIIGIKAGIF